MLKDRDDATTDISSYVNVYMAIGPVECPGMILRKSESPAEHPGMILVSYYINQKAR